MILLVRHGETAGNASRVIQFPDTPLSERNSPVVGATRLSLSRPEDSTGDRLAVFKLDSGMFSLELASTMATRAWRGR